MKIENKQTSQCYDALMEKLARNEQQHTPILSSAEAAITICHTAIRELKTMVLARPFADAAEEIDFFKHIKPLFMAELLYYVKIYQLHARWPVGSAEQRQHYLERGLKQAQQFYEDNLDFYGYYRTGSTNMDALYFICSGQPYGRHLQDGSYYLIDAFSTGYDLLVAQILAFNRLQEYLESLLDAPDNGLSRHMAALDNHSTLLWTGEKVDLVTLAYAIAEAGVCNNGKASVRDIIAALEMSFNTDLRYHARYMIDIRRRKSDKPSFIDRLLTAFKKYITRLDE